MSKIKKEVLLSFLLHAPEEIDIRDFVRFLEMYKGARTNNE